ncbi:MAG: DUF3592 domain-containing protein [Pseudomonadota bacterium]
MGGLHVNIYIGGFLMLIGAMHYLVWRDRLDKWTKVPGQIVDVRLVPWPSISVGYAYKGKRYVATSNYWGRRRMLGKEATVYVNPEKPDAGELYSALHYGLYVYLFPLFGAIWVVGLFVTGNAIKP